MLHASFTTEMVSDQMIVGCYDGEILSKASTLLTFQDRYDAMLALELGKKAKHDLAQPTVSQETGTIAAQKSAYRKSKDRPRERPAPPSTATDRTPAPDTKCYGCGNNIHGRTMREHRDKKPSLCPARDSVCSHCSRRGHLSSLCQGDGSAFAAVQTPTAQDTPTIFAVESHAPEDPPGVVAAADTPKIPHMEWDGGEFRRCQPSPPPTLDIKVEVMDKCHEKFGRHRSRDRQSGEALSPVPVTAIADSGAQTCTSGPELLRTLHIPPGYLIQTGHRSVEIDNHSPDFPRCALLTITHGSLQTQQVIYITKGVKRLYLSKQALINLNILAGDFPARPTQAAATPAPPEAATSDVQAECGCLIRTKPPHTMHFHVEQQIHWRRVYCSATQRVHSTYASISPFHRCQGDRWTSTS